MPDWTRFIGLIGLVSGLLVSSAVVCPEPGNKGDGVIKVLAEQAQAGDGLTIETVLVNLPDGTYQLCSEPDPQDWRDGAGTCFNGVKQGVDLEGYYGYPHSDDFVCLRGRITADQFNGQGMAVSWAGRTWPEIPQNIMNWDVEGRLRLGQGAVVRSESHGADQVDWIVFKQASLNLQGFHLYVRSPMVSPSQLCDWQTN